MDSRPNCPRGAGARAPREKGRSAAMRAHRNEKSNQSTEDDTRQRQTAPDSHMLCCDYGVQNDHLRGPFLPAMLQLPRHK